tara:strand:- start:20 stop:628 length:609 start_codon:yes stop_codon:yes gene_type:complete
MALVKYNNRSILNVTAFDSIASGGLNLIATNTISSGVSSSSFTSGISSTYDTYLFKFFSMHPATDDKQFSFNLSTDGGSNYNVTKTTTVFRSLQSESGATTSLGYENVWDLAQSTAYQYISTQIGNGNDESCSGELYLFSPSNTTFVKHFIARFNGYLSADYSEDTYSAGYANTTSAINAIDFKFASGNIDSGVIKMYGITK